MKIYPEILLAAKTNPETKELIHGFRFWFLAKHYDREGGSGLIHEKEFRTYLRRLGVSRATYYRWKKQARELDLFTDHRKILQLVSWGRAARIAGCRRPKMVEVSIKRFIDDHDLSTVWAGYMYQHEPKPATDAAPGQKQNPITKTTLRRLTGIPERTQRRYEAKAGIKKNSNTALVCSDVAKTPDLAIAEEGNGFFNKHGKQYQRLGNTYWAPYWVKPVTHKVDGRTQKTSRGRTDKIIRELNATLSPMSGGDQMRQRVRLYFLPIAHKEKDKKTGRMITVRDSSPEKQIIKKGLPRLAKINAWERPERVYGYQRTWNGKGLWTAWNTAQGVPA